MPVRTAGISGVAVTIAVSGLYLVYTGVKNVPVVDGLRDIVAGRTPAPIGGIPVTGGGGVTAAGGGANNLTSSGAFFANLGQGVAAPDQAAAGADAAANTPAGASRGDALVNAARRYIGRPYQWGKTFVGGGGGDCSGLVMRSFADIGITCPRTSWQIYAWRALVKVAGPPQPGDVLWYPGHVAIASGGGDMIEAPDIGLRVREVSVRRGATVLRYRG